MTKLDYTAGIVLKLTGNKTVCLADGTIVEGYSGWSDSFETAVSRARTLAISDPGNTYIALKAVKAFHSPSAVTESEYM